MKSIFKSMSCLVLGAMIVTPMFAQQKKLYPELEGPGPVVIISKDKNGKEELINVFEETQRPHFHDPLFMRKQLLTVTWDVSRKW